jgi:hypothetical protein
MIIGLKLATIDAIKEAGKVPLIQLLDSYGGWPILTTDWDESNFNWKKASSSLLIKLGIHIFFNITTIVDLDHTSNNIIFVLDILLNFIATAYTKFQLHFIFNF